MKIDSKDFRVPPKKKVKLKEWPTEIKPFYKSKKHYRELLDKQVDQLALMERLHYACNCTSLLLIFQGMDCSGKDGIIRHVMSGINPQGCEVYSFKQPSTEELEHDFLWRTTCRLPERGRIGIFNRSYYEEVVVVRVHPELLLKQGLSKDVAKKKKLWNDRYQSILHLEEHLHRNSTYVIKFFLHLSKEEQTKRILSRIDDPTKNWKLSISDVQERKFWNEYMTAYEDCLTATSTNDNPWYIVPADDKANARLIVSQVVLDTMHDLKLSYPKMTKGHKQELETIRKLL